LPFRPPKLFLRPVLLNEASVRKRQYPGCRPAEVQFLGYCFEIGELT